MTQEVWSGLDLQAVLGDNRDKLGGTIMLTVFGRKNRFCDRMDRRDFLKVGALGLGGPTLADLLRLRAQAGPAPLSPKAVIMVCLPGGPSHMDTYDLKPEAPEEYRGEFRPIRTNVPGLDICELLPLQARIADKLAVVRNLQFVQPNHQLHEVYTGFPTDAHRPALGSVVSKLRAGTRSELPSYISLSLSDHPRTVALAEDASYLGPAHRPFEPSLEGQANLGLGAGLTPERLADRRALLRTFDTMRRDLDLRGDMSGLDAFQAKALEMITSARVRDAFDVSREPEKLRQRYGPDIHSQFNYQFGHTWYGTKFLLARRLVEAGVPVVTLAVMGWDHHGNLNGVRGSIFERSREQLPWLDRSLSALVTDLHERGLDRDVAVVVWGEFGRTPRINKYGGRDHWTPAGFALLAGGGLRTGQVVGATDARGEKPRNKACTPQNVLATLYHVLGIDPTLTFPDHAGRPVHLLDDCHKIGELL